MIPIYGIRAKDPALFISWSRGKVLNRRTFKNEPIKFVTMGEKKVPYVSKKILSD